MYHNTSTGAPGTPDKASSIFQRDGNNDTLSFHNSPTRWTQESSSPSPSKTAKEMVPVMKATKMLPQQVHTDHNNAESQEGGVDRSPGRRHRHTNNLDFSATVLHQVLRGGRHRHTDNLDFSATVLPQLFPGTADPVTNNVLTM
jgi:hypothetical protein